MRVLEMKDASIYGTSQQRASINPAVHMEESGPGTAGMADNSPYQDTSQGLMRDRSFLARAIEKGRIPFQNAGLEVRAVQ